MLPRLRSLFESATHQIRKAEGGAGLLLIVDELGKFLEYAAQNPEHGDLFVLQSLAEFAARSDQTPFLMLTILHQAFEQYAQRLAKSQREEWAKVQGRFEDVSFVEPTEQVLRLIGGAIERTAAVKKSDLSVAVDLELKPHQLDTKEFISLLESCLPLHPTVALIVSSFFHRFAQNERSLFALLNSSEPHGLQDFLAKPDLQWTCPTNIHAVQPVRLSPHRFGQQSVHIQGWEEVGGDRVGNCAAARTHPR